MPLKPKLNTLSISEIIRKLPIINENIMMEAANQPLLFMEGAKYRIAKMRVRADALAQLESEKALVGLKLRSQRDETGKKAHTEDGVKARTERAVIKSGARAKLDRAYEFEELSKLLITALQQRSWAIRTIAEAENIFGMREDKDVSRIQENNAMRKQARELTLRRSKLGDDDEQ